MRIYEYMRLTMFFTTSKILKEINCAFFKVRHIAITFDGNELPYLLLRLILEFEFFDAYFMFWLKNLLLLLFVVIHTILTGHRNFL